MTESQYKERKEEMIQASMQMICNCGEAGARIHNALQKASNEEFNNIDDFLKEAKEFLNKAHLAQTHIIQTGVELDKEVTLLLFNHAQDIYMTKCNELMTAEHIINLYKKISNLSSK